MRKKLLLLTTLIFTAVSGAWAENVLYGIMNGTQLTLYCGDNKELPEDAIEYSKRWGNYSWSSYEVEYATSIVTDASCSNYNGTSTYRMFSDFSSVTSIDLRNLNTSNITNMSCMFASCYELTNITFGSHSNTSNVTDMSYMFYGCSGLTSLNLSNFN